MLQNKQRLAEEIVLELRTALQTKIEQMSRSNYIMSSMLERTGSLQTQIANMEAKTIPNPESMPFASFIRQIPQSQSVVHAYIEL